MTRGYTMSRKTGAREKGTLARQAKSALARRGYALEAAVGSGRMGTVYRARQTSLDRLVAVKILAPERSQDAGFVQRFHHEAKLVAGLNHPHIVTGIDVGCEDDCYFFVMEFLGGGTLATRLEAEGPLAEKECLQYLAACSWALSHAGQAGLIHCDLKPENLLLDERGRVKITDFGIATIMGQTGSGAGVVLGTPHYLSPEQVRAEAGLDSRTDIYSLGAAIYHLLTGHTPFHGKTNKEIALARLRRIPAAPERYRPDLGAETAALLKAMLSHDRADRPASPRALQERLAKMGFAAGRRSSTSRRKTRSQRLAPPGADTPPNAPPVPRPPPSGHTSRRGGSRDSRRSLATTQGPRRTWLKWVVVGAVLALAAALGWWLG